MALANRVQIIRAAHRIAAVFSNNNKKYIIMGGGASIIQGSEERQTRDLDINVLKMDDRLIAKMAAAGITVRPNRNTPKRWNATIPESSPGAKNATSVDIALRPEIEDVLGHAEVVDGVVVAGLHLLLVDKIKTMSSRGVVASAKTETDLQDVLFCTSEIERRKKGLVPHNLKQCLTDDIWMRFWAQVLHAGRGAEDLSLIEEALRVEAGLDWPPKI
ncbi:hypothetical protein BDN71DRAFT_1446205 [Pleurotus eryngii]|uniref:Uncharacterized protein n=1 Tax=Pleurotus eryngii TaxID=5323 RepID=A0A9P5ZXV1_PLEER|nr:hypothetical protein BDN71DRAFT_1446205 [Pleurotus eryngii]